MQNVTHDNNVGLEVTILIGISIDLPRVFFFASLCLRTNLWLTYCYFYMHARKCNGCNRFLSGCFRQNV